MFAYMLCRILLFPETYVQAFSWKKHTGSESSFWDEDTKFILSMPLFDDMEDLQARHPDLGHLFLKCMHMLLRGLLLNLEENKAQGLFGF